jgi:hypothetical protein
MHRLAQYAERPPSPDTRYTPAWIAAARERGDPLGDRVVEELIAARANLHDPANAVRAATTPACKELRERVEAMPAWVDFDRMRPGSEHSLRHVVQGGLALLCGGLVESYSDRRGVKVLALTGQLAKNTFHRLYETVQFTSDIALCGGPKPGSVAHDQAIAVRLMHAAARRRCLHDPRWDEAWGLPINQTDLLATQLQFSHVFRRGVASFGVRIPDEVHDAIHHCWRAVGWVLGVEEETQPTSTAEEEDAYLAITGAIPGADEDSRAMVRTLFSAVALRPPFFVPEAALHAAARQVVGDRLADEMHLDRHPGWEAALRSIAAGRRAVSPLGDWVPGRERAAVQGGVALSAAVRWYGVGLRRARFGLRP